MGAVASRCECDEELRGNEITFLDRTADEGLVNLEAPPASRSNQAFQGCSVPELPDCEVNMSQLGGALLHSRNGGLTDQEYANVLLAQASIRGEVEDVKRALSKGANVDTRAELSIAMGEHSASSLRRLTPLMRACRCGHAKVVTILVEKEASLWRADADGWTPLCHAIAASELDIARQLLEAAGVHGNRQKAIARTKLAQIYEQSEEDLDEKDIDKLLELDERISELELMTSMPATERKQKKKANPA
eukprot:TRINITY_DN37903_c0_g1_i1.p1 TRINITY_DN37903_c0_g1~~TRINITY_DN37903_c0_g1_i1.p1  ORF type:complete len:248 (-),score=48.02 TRINITY_DN37903_c0_g1_i1:119-862(-)